MTTPPPRAEENRTFEERLKKEAEDHCCYDCFKEGGLWAREQTIAEVLGLLRGDDAWEFHSKHGCSIGGYITSVYQWADWLESKLAQSVHQELTDESEVKLKNPIYRWPDDEL